MSFCDRDRKDAVVDERAHRLLEEALLAAKLKIHPAKPTRMRLFPHASLVLGLILALTTAVAFNWSWVAQHTITSRLPALTVRQPRRSLGAPLLPAALAVRLRRRDRRLGALHRRAQAGAALARPGGLGRRARAARRVRAARLGGAAPAPGVARRRAGRRRARPPLGLARGRVGGSNSGSRIAVAAWFLASCSWPARDRAGGAAARPRRRLRARGGLMYAAADVGTKAAVAGGASLLFVAPGRPVTGSRSP